MPLFLFLVINKVKKIGNLTNILFLLIAFYSKFIRCQ